LEGGSRVVFYARLFWSRNYFYVIEGGRIRGRGNLAGYFTRCVVEAFHSHWSFLGSSAVLYADVAQANFHIMPRLSLHQSLAFTRSPEIFVAYSGELNLFREGE
jgi:hypothetical protein